MRNTNFVKVKYNEIYDVGTKYEDDVGGRLTILGFHTPVGSKPRELLGGLFSQFRWFKYTGCKLAVQSLQPLPVDPLQVGFEAGEQISPKSMADPVVFKGCHGENLGYVLNQMMADSGFAKSGESVDVEDDTTFLTHREQFYYSLLTDPKFKKYAPQQSWAKRLYPMVHRANLLYPMLPSSDFSGTENFDSGKFLPNESPDNTEVLQDVQFSLPTGRKVPTEYHTDEFHIPVEDKEFDVSNDKVTIPYNSIFFGSTTHKHDIDTAKLNDALAKSFVEIGSGGTGQGTGVQNPNYNVSAEVGGRLASNQMFTSGVKKLGWLPTRLPIPSNDGTGGSGYVNNTYVNLPKLMMGVMILPPSHSRGYNFYYRIYLQHTFLFKGFSLAIMGNNSKDSFKSDYHDFLERPEDSSSIDSVGAKVERVNAGISQ